MTRVFCITAIVLSVFGAAGATLAGENWPQSVDQYVAQVRATIETTDMDGYLAAVNNPNGALLLDVREENEFEAGHVPGTVNIPRGLLELRIWKQLGYPGDVDMGRRIYVQCATGIRATLAAKQLNEIGFNQRCRRNPGFARMGEEWPSTREAVETMKAVRVLDSRAIRLVRASSATYRHNQARLTAGATYRCRLLRAFGTSPELCRSTHAPSRASTSSSSPSGRQ